MSEQGWIFILGIIAAIAAYLAKNFIFEPLLEYRKVKGRIQNRLKYHANIITSSGFALEQLIPVWEELRQLSCNLDEVYATIPFTQRLWWHLRVPSPESINAASAQLIFLSNGAGAEGAVEHNYKSVEEIKKHLKIDSI